MNEKEGLVYQTENTQKPNYICGCCGDCCAILNILKLLPKPVDFARGNFQTSINKDLCIGCGTCVDRCQMNAITMIEKNNRSSVRIERCIGCGLCVPTCEGGAIQLKRRAQEEIPEEDRESYMNMIEVNRRNWFQKVGKVLKLLFSRKIFHPFSGG
jgi:MinD superfamily P-loop ATPase